MGCRSPDITYLDRLATDRPGDEADASLAAKPTSMQRCLVSIWCDRALPLHSTSRRALALMASADLTLAISSVRLPRSQTSHSSSADFPRCNAFATSQIAMKVLARASSTSKDVSGAPRISPTSSFRLGKAICAGSCSTALKVSIIFSAFSDSSIDRQNPGGSLRKHTAEAEICRQYRSY